MKVTKIKIEYKHSAEECEKFDAEVEDETLQEGFANEQDVFCPKCSALIASWPTDDDDWTINPVAGHKICEHVKFILVDECDCAWQVSYFNHFDEAAFRALLKPIAEEDAEDNRKFAQEHPGNMHTPPVWEPGNMTCDDWERIEPTETVKEVLLWEPVDSPLASAGYIIWIGIC